LGPLPAHRLAGVAGLPSTTGLTLSQIFRQYEPHSPKPIRPELVSTRQPQRLLETGSEADKLRELSLLFLQCALSQSSDARRLHSPTGRLGLVCGLHHRFHLQNLIPVRTCSGRAAVGTREECRQGCT
jgi:hypothetical protein